MSEVEKEIKRLVNLYPWSDSKELFESELRYLVALAEREQIKKDIETLGKVK